MNPRLMAIPIIMLWATVVALGLKLLKRHLLLNGMMENIGTVMFLQLKCLVVVALLSCFIYELERLIDFILFGDDD